jgi:hypothetical protein
LDTGVTDVYSESHKAHVKKRICGKVEKIEALLKHLRDE